MGTKAALQCGFAVSGSHGCILERLSDNRFAVEVDYALLEQSGWQEQLRRFWKEVSVLIQPIYAEVRTLKGQPRSRWFTSDPEREEHPVRAWFWRGIPKNLGCAAVLGAAYQQLWPACNDHAEHSRGLVFLSTADWLSGETLSGILGEVPHALASPPAHLRESLHSAFHTLEDYPPQWPFEAPFTDRPKP